MREPLFEKIMKNISDPNFEFLTPLEQEYKDRVLLVMKIKLKNLHFTDYKVFLKVKKQYPTLTYAQVARDIMLCERMIAFEINPKGNPQKTFLRYFITEMNKKALAIALEKNDAYGISFATSVIGKHNLTDKEDVERPKYEDIVPFNFEPSFDPTVLGLKPIQDIEKVREKLEKKFDRIRANFNSTHVIEDIQEEAKDEFDS